MTELSERARTELRAIVEQYAAGEAEVPRTYFASEHTPDENLDVLLRQMGREIQAANRLRVSADMFDKLEAGTERHAFRDYLEHIAEETKHYVILADLAEWVAGRPLGAEEARRYEVYPRVVPDQPPEKNTNRLLPEANRMMQVSRDLIEALGFERGNEVARLTEGGGGGAFVVCANLRGDPFRDRLAAAMLEILADEIHHGPERVDGFAETWVRNDEDLATAKTWLRRFMAQHLRVRNEIWNFPLTEGRLEAIDRGEVAPLEPLREAL
ncbi:MAG: hypothetical protein HW416_3151, partial [Chloroflexi bacterium]|nr:hypothetical protein [Chloroflexota bacterium]